MPSTTKISEDLGRLFEVGFNIGILAFIEQNPDRFKANYGTLYREDLARLSFSAIFNKLVARAGLLSVADQKIVKQWFYYSLERGYLSGYNFLAEYLNAVGWNKPNQQLEIVYYQCSFCNDNSIGTRFKSNEYQLMLEAQLGTMPPPIYEEYAKKGEFLRADCLMFLKHRQQYRVVCADLSMFASKVFADDDKIDNHAEPVPSENENSFFGELAAEEGLPDLDNPQVLRQMLLKEVSYLQSKSVFSRLSIDTGKESLGLTFSKGLSLYFTAFAQTDKESSKLIQAASYAFSFYNFLKEQQIAGVDPDSIIFNVLGYTNRGMSGMAVTRENLPVLQTCAEIYKSRKRTKVLHDARRQLLEEIQRNAAKSFEDGRSFLANLFNDKGKGSPIVHREIIEGFYNSSQAVDPEILRAVGLPAGNSKTLTYKDAHADLINQALESDITYLFLTGNPGIGKTTSIVKYLKAHVDEGFLFIYASPRTQVNLDTLAKFKADKTSSDQPVLAGPLFNDSLYTLNTNSILIKEHGSGFTSRADTEGDTGLVVQYVSNRRRGNFVKDGIKFIDGQPSNEQEAEKGVVTGAGVKSSQIYSSSLRRVNEDTIQDAGEKVGGVLTSMCKAIHTMITNEKASAIAATVTIQSLRRKPKGDTTLVHLNEIFRSAYREKEGIVLADKMRAISSRIKNIFIMVDEITGDEGGVEFVNGVKAFLKRFNLLDRAGGQYGFNVKVIVSDASIVDANVIRQHLTPQTIVEPDKVFFRRVPVVEKKEAAPNSRNTSTKEEVGKDAPEQGANSARVKAVPLSCEKFRFTVKENEKEDALVINSNTYPASQLAINYKVFVDAFEFDPETFPKRRDFLPNTVQIHILRDLQKLLDKQQQQTESSLELDATQLPNQIIVYIQDKQRLAELISKLKVGREFKEYEHYVQIHSNLSEQGRAAVEKCKDKVQVVFMTASASRGLSFPRARHIMIDVPRFEVEQNLMEIIQVIYRGRGNPEFERLDKELYFYLADRAVYSPGSKEIERELKLKESFLSLVNILLIMKTAIMTRIFGSGRIGSGQFMIIPIGGKSIASADETFSDRMITLIKELKNTHRNFLDHKDLEVVAARLTELLGQAEISLSKNLAKSSTDSSFVNKASKKPNSAPASYLAMRENFQNNFANALNEGFAKLLQLEPFQNCYVSGSLLIVPIEDRTVDISYEMSLQRQFSFADEQMQKKLQQIKKNPMYPSSLKMAVNKAIELAKRLNDGQNSQQQKSQSVEQSGQRPDQYYAVPIFMLTSLSAFKNYYQRKPRPEEPEGESFRILLASHVRSITGVTNFVPITPDYHEFPFVLFRSYGLVEVRGKIFLDQHLLTSTELNVLNLILTNN